jgi:peptide/nickel transport system substrate-binding protein
MDEIQRRVDAIRRSRSEVENHVIDEYRAGKISRREFVRRGTVVGMSIPLLGFLAAACGGDDAAAPPAAPPAEPPAPPAEPPPPPAEPPAAPPPEPPAEPPAPPAEPPAAPPAAAGGALRTGIIAPATALNPLVVYDEGGLAVLGQSGEYLTWTNDKLELEPRLAESWTPNEDGSVWTFTIRQGVTFHDGKPLTAADVAYTLNLHADPANKGNALSAFGDPGGLSPGGAKALDDATVEVTLNGPNGGFPYLVSADNYNLVIVPEDFDPNAWEQSFVGTGPWILDTFTPQQGVTYRRNDAYWDTSRIPIADTSELRFYAEDQARVLALQGGEVDVLSQFQVVAGGDALLNDPNVVVLELRAAQHRQIHMRADQEPFADKRVRQAMALLLDRPAVVEGFFQGKADLGNDHPFAPVYPFSDTTVAQRAANVEQARQLLADAGKADGFEVQLSTWDNYEIPQLAQLLQSAAKEVGITITLNVTDAGTYYSDFWLNSPLGITDYGHRGVPNVYLTAALGSTGTWNAAHFANPALDQLIVDYVAALDLDSQRSAAKTIEELLLDETPVIFPYFYYHLSATRSNVSGIVPTGMGHIDLTKTGFTA